MGRSRFMLCVLAVGAMILAAVMARVVVDTATDPTSHNLWPFELVLAGFVAGVTTAAGTALGSFSRRRAS